MIFVFGSNESGRHGRGAALTAFIEHGAEYGQGFGRAGNSFAIPTRDKNVKTLPLGDIDEYVDRFLEYAREHCLVEFKITRVGCGLAGYRDAQMAPLFFGSPENCFFDPAWVVFGFKTWEGSNDR